jgi:hypothetical protein
MRSSSPLARFVLIVSALLVLALVVVLYLSLRPSLESGGTTPGAQLPDQVAASGEHELPAPTAGEDAAAPQPLPQPEAPPVERLGPNAIVGRVIDDATSQPVAAFHVDVLPAEPGPPLERLAAAHDRPERSKPFTSAAGIFRLERTPGRWDVIVSAEGYLPGVLADVVVPAVNGQPTEIRLLHGPSIVGLVTDVEGRPAPDVPVFLHVTRQFTDAPPPEVTLARSDAAGRFRFSPLPPGEYAISMLELDNTVDRLTGLRVESGTVDVSLPLQPRHQVVFIVRDPADRPIEGATVELTGSGGASSDATNGAGQAVLRYLSDGEYDLSIERDGYEPLRERVPLQGGAREQVRYFRLSPAAGR